MSWQRIGTFAGAGLLLVVSVAPSSAQSERTVGPDDCGCIVIEPTESYFSGVPEYRVYNICDDLSVTVKFTGRAERLSHVVPVGLVPGGEESIIKAPAWRTINVTSYTITSGTNSYVCRWEETFELEKVNELDEVVPVDEVDDVYDVYDLEEGHRDYLRFRLRLRLRFAHRHAHHPPRHAMHPPRPPHHPPGHKPPPHRPPVVGHLPPHHPPHHPHPPGHLPPHHPPGHPPVVTHPPAVRPTVGFPSPTVGRRGPGGILLDDGRPPEEHTEDMSEIRKDVLKLLKKPAP
jgi:hypothetical protein